VIEKLQVDGVNLRDPHQKAVMQPAGAGLRELRPTAGKNPWRPLYRQVGPRLFAILAVAPEAEIDERGYDQAVQAAQRRRQAVEKVLEKKAAAGRAKRRR
jgi:hypothetical protein